MYPSPSYTKNYSVVGFNHKSVPVAQRELVAAADTKPRTLLGPLVEECHLEEAAVISTCNRFEVVSVGRVGAEREVAEFLSDRLKRQIPPSAFYQYKDRQAIRHLFQVASSLDSLVVGEAQILGQVKESYNVARELGHIKKYLHHLFQFTFSLAKKVRANTAIAEKGVSVSYIAVQLAKQIFGELSDRTVLIIGSGKMAELVALHLSSYGCKNIVVANRTVERAAELASRVGGSAVSLDDIPAYLEKADVVVGSISVDRPVIEYKSLAQRKRARSVFLIDLGVPRNFSPSLAELDDVYLYNLDDLSEIAQKNKSVREEAARDAEIVIDYGVVQFERWLTKVSSEPALLNFRRTVRSSVEEELRESLRGRMSEAELEELLPSITHKVSQKVTHDISSLIIDSPHGKLEPSALVPLFFDTFFELEE